MVGFKRLGICQNLCFYFKAKQGKRRARGCLARSGNGCRLHPPPAGRPGAVTSLHRIKHPSHTTISSSGLSAIFLIYIFIEPIGFWLLPPAKRTQTGLNLAQPVCWNEGTVIDHSWQTWMRSTLKLSSRWPEGSACQNDVQHCIKAGSEPPQLGWLQRWFAYSHEEQ